MYSNDILSYVRSPSNNTPSSVYDRLYQDFSVRNKNRFTENKSNSKLKQSSRLPEYKIEDELLQKQALIQNKLKKLKAKYEAEEMKEVRSAPQINQLSRLIASQRPEKAPISKSKYISSILANSRFIKRTKCASSISLSKNVLIKLEPEPKTEIFKPPEPNKDDIPSLVEMSAAERGKNWISQRIQKLQQLKELSEQSLKPAPTVVRSRAQSVCTSYTEIYQQKRLRTPSRVRPRKISTSERSLDGSLIMKKLSPMSQRLSFPAGGNLDRLLKPTNN